MHSTSYHHRSVLLDETLRALAPRSGAVYADATLGGGGHAEGILDASSPDGKLIGVDRDPAALDAARARLARFGDRVTFVHGSFGGLASICAGVGMPRVDGVVADLGVSSPQLDDATRGFSFRAPGPLDMRMDPTQGPTVLELIGEHDERSLADLIYELGEERRSRAIARSIRRAYEEGALETTEDLRHAVLRAVGRGRGRGIDPATRTFQALRIAVNEELRELDRLLEALPELLEDEGRAALISFHSLEDRRVKRFFRGHAAIEPLTKRPVIAGETERAENPRARSAKLRGARRRARAEVGS